MNKFVRILNGSYRSAPVTNTVFQQLKPVGEGKRGLFVTVANSGMFPGMPEQLRIRIYSVDDVQQASAEEFTGEVQAVPTSNSTVEAEQHVDYHANETDEEAMDRIRERFAILDQMTNAVADGLVRGVIVSGPPGVGKSFGVEKVLEDYDMITKLAGKPPRTEVVKGSLTPIGLYKTLYDSSNAGDILVFDDADSILFDEVCLNMLKAVLDSGEKRKVSWKSESAALRREGIPDQFDFKGGVIFITNINFENVRSKKIKDHLEALMSRCHYLDLTMDSMRDRFLRIRQIVRDGMLDKYNFGEAGNQELIQFMEDHQQRLREVSLRMVTKIADLRKMDAGNWKRLAETTCMKRLVPGVGIR